MLNHHFDRAMLQQAIEIAARIWADKLKTYFYQDNGDPQQSKLLNILISRQPRPSEVEIILFEQALIQELETQTVLFYKPTETYYFGVDYSPDRVLFDACRASGIAWCHLPIKSHTNFNSQQVSYSFGYGTPYTTITVNDKTALNTLFSGL